MFVVALTGGIAMGKSTATNVFRRARVPVFDADAAVHNLQAFGGGAVRAIGKAFPDSVHSGRVDRAILRRIVLDDSTQLRRLESIMHPMVAAERRRFLARQRRAGKPLVVLDIPLLFELGPPCQVDLLAVVSAPASVQMHRIRRRQTMSVQQADAIIARQTPDSEKRRRADVVIRTGLSRYHAQRQVRQLIRICR